MDDLPPLVSVVIPAYNAEAFIEETINSVLKQTYQQIEILVVDDGSCDRTAELVSAIAQRDRRVVLLQQANSGVAAARNLGIRQAKGQFIAPLDADDIWYPQNIEKQVKCMLTAGEKVGLVYSWSVDIDEKSQLLGGLRNSYIEGHVYTTLLLHDFIANASSVLIRKTCFEQVGGYDSALKQQRGQGGEDWDIYLRISQHYEFRVIPNVLVGYRKLPGSMSTDSRQMARSRYLIWQKLRQKYPHIPIAIERLSNSSFYMHLAAQNYYYARYQATLLWLIEAIKVDPITPFLRLGVYKIAAISLWKSLLQPSQKEVTLSPAQMRSPKNSKQSRFTIQPKLLGEMALHRFISPLFGTSENWL